MGGIRLLLWYQEPKNVEYLFSLGQTSLIGKIGSEKGDTGGAVFPEDGAENYECDSTWDYSLYAAYFTGIFRCAVWKRNGNLHYDGLSGFVSCGISMGSEVDGN